MSDLFYYRAGAIAPAHDTLDTDVCIYGGTAAGVVAALTAARLGKSAVILEQSAHLGGLTTGGLCETDFGHKEIIGGLALEFYRRLGAHYGTQSEWRFEPHVVQKGMDEMAAHSGAPVFYRQFLRGVETNGKRIVAVELEGGLKVRARMFLDCTYEGDLMAAAGCSFHVGREDNSTFGETLNGAQVRPTHQFDLPVSPFTIEGDRASDLLPFVEARSPQIGQGDGKMQAYNFRLCLTQRADNRIPFEKPLGYDSTQYELLARYLRAGYSESEMFRKFDLLRGDKVDKNNHGAVSTDFIGANWDYPTATYEQRELIFQDHVLYQKGLMWFLGNDSRVPKNIRERWNSWGLCRDEFTDCGGWSQSLYVREGRRLMGDVVVTEADCRGRRKCEDPIGMASYSMDSHNATRFVTPEGHVQNEGDVQVKVEPYSLSYRALRPREDECQNLLVPVACSTSHIAFGSVRMEPVFMLLAQSAASAACLAIDDNGAVQNVSYPKLRAQLEKDGQVLNWP